MTDIPKCTSWRGHKFEARYSKSASAGPGDYEGAAIALVELAERRRSVTYERDICVRCGATVEKKPAPKPPETQA